MSVLETFVRIRRFRIRAAEFYQLAAQPLSFGVRERYLAVADHYTALADAELSWDRVARKRRLDNLRVERERSAAERRSYEQQSCEQQSHRQQSQPAPLAPHASERVKLRLIHGAGQGKARASRSAAAPSAASPLRSLPGQAIRTGIAEPRPR